MKVTSDSETVAAVQELTCGLIPCRKVHLEKLTVTHLVKKFPAFYGTWRFINVFTRACHWFLFWARWMQFTLSCPISLKFFLILSSHLFPGLLCGTFPSGLPSWEANSHSASQEIPCLLWNPVFITAFTRACQWSLTWSLIHTYTLRVGEMEWKLGSERLSTI
jgi:hypothetical protein